MTYHAKDFEIAPLFAPAEGDSPHENPPPNAEQRADLTDLDCLDSQLQARFQTRLSCEAHLTRQMVSNQANKARPVYRWYRYKEAFSADLVAYLLDRYGITSGRLLDPFAGSGTALFAAGERGLDADGIELLAIGQQIVETKQLLQTFTSGDFAALAAWVSRCPWETRGETVPLPTLRITGGAYPPETLAAIERYQAAWQTESAGVQQVLRFALLCVLETMSYTRKDGQYLRWDYRSGRRQGARPFNKGAILPFGEAIRAKIAEIIEDTRPQPAPLFAALAPPPGALRLLAGSCLDILPTLETAAYDGIITSPPYCNRYDYTRTYALELALLGTTESELVSLRQQMLSCTVENRAKDLRQMNPSWDTALRLAENQPLLQKIIAYLHAEKARGTLNNAGIPRMVTGYFYEMACVLAECSRLLKPGAYCFVVNDNVRYNGASISVDLILADLAENLGFTVESILVLPGGKGNSSQQMGLHGREALRKCVYVWRRR